MKASLFLIIILVFLSFAQSQDHYRLEFWGIPCGTITMDQPDPETLTFETQSQGILDWIYPFHNEYSVSFDTSTFNLRSLSKKIRQGSEVEKFTGTWDPDRPAIVYNQKIVVPRETEVMTVLSLLALVMHRSPQEIDTRWFPLEHEGALYRARFIWAGVDTLSILNEDQITDHYRLDFELVDDSGKILAHSDFFHEYITTDGLVKQLWVTSKTPKKILQAQVSLSGMTLKARLRP